MSNTLQCLEKQITTCKAMMALFQQERQLIQESETTPLHKIQENLKRKELLAAALTQAIAGLHGAGDTGEGERRQSLLREVAALLEQLLVIEQENSRVLRGRLKQSQEAAATPATTTARPRRSTLPGALPFLPPRADLPAKPRAPRRPGYPIAPTSA